MKNCWDSIPGKRSTIAVEAEELIELFNYSYCYLDGDEPIYGLEG